MSSSTAFNHHLDNCKQCREHPHALCPLGHDILTGVPATPEAERAQMDPKDKRAVIFRVMTHENSEEWLPERAHDSDAGWDLKARLIKDVETRSTTSIKGREMDLADGDGDPVIYRLTARSRVLVMTGVTIALAPYWEAQVRPRSGMAAKSGITVTNAPGTIDAGYRGEIGVILQNTGNEGYNIARGSKIAQLVIKRFPFVALHHVKSLDDTDRGAGGFGSTGS